MWSSWSLPWFSCLCPLLSDRRPADPSKEHADLGERELPLTLWRAQDLACSNNLLPSIWYLGEVEICYYGFELDLIGRGEGVEIEQTGRHRVVNIVILRLLLFADFVHEYFAPFIPRTHHCCFVAFFRYDWIVWAIQ
jgi:hypothetical protein